MLSGPMLRTRIGYLVAITALVISLFGLFSSIAATPASGVGIDNEATVVTNVLPGSPEWRDGIRTGDSVVAFRPSSEPGGWALEARSGDLVHETSAVSQESRLRATMPVAAIGTALLLVGLLLVLRREPLGFALIPIAVSLAALPLLHTGSARDELVAGVGTFLLAGGAVAANQSRPRTALITSATGFALAALWVASLVAVPAAFDTLDAARVPVAGVFAVWGGWIAIDRRRLVERLLAPDGPNAFDLLYLPGIGAALAAGVVTAGVPPVLAAVVFALAVAAYPATRGGAIRAFERLVIGNVRRRAELRAIEDERGRMAREIHDAPLQELAAVIRRLEAKPDAAGETSALREVASQLRDVATALHPPVLQDLGLAAALEDLGEALAAAHAETAVRVEVDDLTTGAARPDADAEVTAFRIAQEAAANAIRHSKGTTVMIAGSVAADAIELIVVDDGAGIDREAAASARRKGHFGLESMRERAEAIGGQLSIESNADGVRVRFRWERTS